MGHYDMLFEEIEAVGYFLALNNVRSVRSEVLRNCREAMIILLTKPRYEIHRIVVVTTAIKEGP